MPYALAFSSFVDDGMYVCEARTYALFKEMLIESMLFLGGAEERNTRR